MYNKIKFILPILLTLVVFSGCEKDDDNTPEVDPLVGKWSFVSATLRDAAPVGVTPNLPAGTDLTIVFGGLLVGSIDCDNPTNGKLQLEESGQILFICDGEGTPGVPNGTWSIDEDRTTLTMVIPIDNEGTPVNFPLVMNNLVETANSISGDINNVPIPRIVFEGLGITVPEGQPLVPINVSVTFMKG